LGLFVANQLNQNSSSADGFNRRRAASRRTALILGVIAASIFTAFVARAVLLALGQG